MLLFWKKQGFANFEGATDTVLTKIGAKLKRE
jgi:hypothetical protein